MNAPDKLSNDEIVELAEFFDLLARYDYEDYIERTSQQKGTVSEDSPIH